MVVFQHDLIFISISFCLCVASNIIHSERESSGLWLIKIDDLSIQPYLPWAMNKIYIIAIINLHCFLDIFETKTLITYVLL